MQNNDNEQKEGTPEREEIQNEADNKTENGDMTDEKSAGASSKDIEGRLNEINDKYLRLYSEFDNYRKRTIKERADIIKTAAEDVLKAILPVIDDFERAIRANENVDDAKAIREGVQLIYNKLKNIAQQKGLVAFESKGAGFDPDLMEAITHIPASSEEEKNIVVDEVEKGYKLGDKVIRYAKVVVAK
jgi:molecular chaperone GrpE